MNFLAFALLVLICGGAYAQKVDVTTFYQDSACSTALSYEGTPSKPQDCNATSGNCVAQSDGVFSIFRHCLAASSLPQLSAAYVSYFVNNTQCSTSYGQALSYSGWTTNVCTNSTCSAGGGSSSICYYKQTCTGETICSDSACTQNCNTISEGWNTGCNQFTPENVFVDLTCSGAAEVLPMMGIALAAVAAMFTF